MHPLNQLLNYSHYRLTSKTPHGIHSPFVYNLVTQVIRDKKTYPAYKQIEALRTKLLRDERVLNTTDLGAGSKKKAAPAKKVKQIARNSAKPARYAQLLFRLVSHFKPTTILELGTSLGLSTLYLAAGNKNAAVITIEGCPETAALAKENFTQLDAPIVLHTGNFDTVLPAVLSGQQTLDFVFIDGNHRKTATLNYVNACIAKSNTDAVFIIDDINWSAEMQQAWQQIKQLPQVTVTLDLFYMGIVFFRKEQAKEHFVIRF